MKQFAEKHAALWQFIKYSFISLMISVVELVVFAFMNFAVFAPFKDQPFQWWILNYPADGGGLGGFLAVISTYIIGQTINFFLQRKSTFKATNSTSKSAVIYGIMIILIWFLQAWMGGVLMKILRRPLGEKLGDMAAACLNMMLSFCIQFPMNKYVIMKNDT